MKKRTAHFSLIAGSIIFALLICEGIVRILGVGDTAIHTHGTYQKFDPDAGWTGLPGAKGRFYLPGSFNVRVTNNSRGLRDSEKGLQKQPGIRRIVVLGDSFMWGYGVENSEMFSTVLQELVRGTESINLGVRGYGTVQELLRLETEGMLYEPDVTLLAFYRNDLENNFDEREGSCPVAVVEGDALRIANRPVKKPWRSPVIQWSRHHSRLFGFCEYSIKLMKHKARERKHANALKAELLAPDTSSPTRKPRKDGIDFSEVDLYAPSRPETDMAWKAFRLLLSRMKELATQNGGALVVVYVTPKAEADREAFSKEIRERGFDPESPVFNWDRPSSRLGDICSALEVPYVNLNPAFRNHSDPSSLYLVGNDHWSAAGHRLAAETVAAAINRSDL